MHGRISAREACNPCGDTMKMSSRYHRLLIYDVKLTTKIDCMGPFNKKLSPVMRQPFKTALDFAHFVKISKNSLPKFISLSLGHIS